MIPAGQAMLSLSLLLSAAPLAAQPTQGQPAGGLRTPIRRHQPANAAAQAATVAPIVVPLANNSECGYVADITVGTPPQNLTLLFDTGSANLFVAGTGCKCSSAAYDPTRSSTYKGSGKFDMFDWCTGAAGADRVALAPGAVIEGQHFGICAKSDILQPPTPGGPWYNGIFGLGMRALEEDSADIVPPLTLMVKQGLIAKQLFSVYLDHTDESQGEIQWGFSDPTKYRGNLTFYPMAVESEGQPHAGEHVYYKANVDTIKLGSDLVQSGAQIMTDTGAVGIYPPTSKILKQLHKLAPVAADCSNKATLPDLTLTIGGDAYTIPSSMYVLSGNPATDPAGNSSCVSAFQEGQDEFWCVSLRSVVSMHH